MSILVFGHKNPDTDSVASAIALSYLKNQLGVNATPRVLGNISKESMYVLNSFKLQAPAFLSDVKVQVKDLQYNFAKGICPTQSILSTYNLMEKNDLEAVGVVDETNALLGIISMKNIAMGLIDGDFYHLETSLENLLNDLKGQLLSGDKKFFDGRISIVAYYYKTIEGLLGKNDILIVGDRYDIIEYAIQSKVQLVIITGGNEIPQKYIDMANENNVTMILVPMDTHYTSKVINMCNYSSKIMNSNNIIKFNEAESLDEVKEELSHSHFRNYPIVDEEGAFLGFINRKHILNPSRKQVILVDHNEYGQSVEGLEEAEILEIVDHHKIGGIATTMPINFRNNIVGSTCTIVYTMFKESRVEIPYEIAGALISGILSDTLLFKSPTTTEIDKRAVADLNQILNLNIDEYAMDMFKYGTSLEGQSIEEIFYKDFKEFNLDSFKTGVSQVFTLDIDDVFNRKDLFLSFIEETHKKMDYDITVLVITDILKEGSYILYKSKHSSLVPFAFDMPDEQGSFVEGIVSRKKQVIPKLSNAIKVLK